MFHINTINSLYSNHIAKLSFLIHLMILLIFSTLLNCDKSPTKPESNTIKGTVLLEGEIDHSGVKIGIYDYTEQNKNLAPLLTEYPSIGCNRIQKGIFDHRNADLLKYVYTDEKGSFSLNFAYEKDIILVIEKEPFGWKYYYLEDKIKNNTIQCTLKKTQILTTNLLMNNIVENSRFYIVENDIEISDSKIEIDSGTVFLFDSNVGMNFTNCILSVNGTNSLPIEFISRDQSQNWNGLNFIESSVNLKHMDIKNTRWGIIGNNSDIIMSELLFNNIAETALYFYNHSQGGISLSTIINSKDGIHTESKSNIIISNCSIYNGNSFNSKGIHINKSEAEIDNCIINNFNIGALFEYGNSIEFTKSIITNCNIGLKCKRISDVIIDFNVFSGFTEYFLYLSEYAYPNVNDNNIDAESINWLIYATGREISVPKEIDIRNNYWQTIDLNEIIQKTTDRRVGPNEERYRDLIKIAPIKISYIENAGPN